MEAPPAQDVQPERGLGRVANVRRRLPAPPNIGFRARLRDRIEARELFGLRRRFRRRRFLALLAVLGPGLIAALAGNDAGGITTYSVMGAETGFRLLWLFPLTMITLAVVQEMSARLGVVTGQGLSGLIRDRYGVRWVAFAMLVLFAANMANTVANFAGIAAGLTLFGLPTLLTVPIAAAVIWGLVLFASYRSLERVFLLISVVFLAYIVSALLARPDWGAVAQGLTTPRFDASGGELLLMVAVVGTTIAPFMQFYLQSAVAEKGIDEEELRLEQVDAVGGALLTNVIALFIVIATATTLFAAGASIQTAGDAAEALGPIAGNLSRTLFGLGLFGASALAATIIPISTAFVICEAFGWEAGVGQRFRDAPAFFSIYTFVLFAGALVVLFLSEGSLIGVILASQNLQGLLLPFVLVFMLLLVNNRKLLGRHVNGLRRNVLAIACIGLVIALDLALLGVNLLGLVGIDLG